MKIFFYHKTNEKFILFRLQHKNNFKAQFLNVTKNKEKLIIRRVGKKRFGTSEKRKSWNNISGQVR